MIVEEQNVMVRLELEQSYPCQWTSSEIETLSRFFLKAASQLTAHALPVLAQ